MNQEIKHHSEQAGGQLIHTTKQRNNNKKVPNTLSSIDLSKKKSTFVASLINPYGTMGEKIHEKQMESIAKSEHVPLNNHNLKCITPNTMTMVDPINDCFIISLNHQQNSLKTKSSKDKLSAALSKPIQTYNDDNSNEKSKEQQKTMVNNVENKRSVTVLRQRDVPSVSRNQSPFVPMHRHSSMNWNYNSRRHNGNSSDNMKQTIWTQGTDNIQNQKVHHIFRCKSQFSDQFVVRSVRQTQFDRDLDLLSINNLLMQKHQNLSNKQSVSQYINSPSPSTGFFKPKQEHQQIQELKQKIIKHLVARASQRKSQGGFKASKVHNLLQLQSQLLDVNIDQISQEKTVKPNKQTHQKDKTNLSDKVNTKNVVSHHQELQSNVKIARPMKLNKTDNLNGPQQNQIDNFTYNSTVLLKSTLDNTSTNKQNLKQDARNYLNLPKNFQNSNNSGQTKSQNTVNVAQNNKLSMTNQIQQQKMFLAEFVMNKSSDLIQKIDDNQSNPGIELQNQETVKLNFCNGNEKVNSKPIYSPVNKKSSISRGNDNDISRESLNSFRNQTIREYQDTQNQMESQRQNGQHTGQSDQNFENINKGNHQQILKTNRTDSYKSRKQPAVSGSATLTSQELYDENTKPIMDSKLFSINQSFNKLKQQQKTSSKTSRNQNLDKKIKKIKTEVNTFQIKNGRIHGNKQALRQVIQNASDSSNGKIMVIKLNDLNVRKNQEHQQLAVCGLNQFNSNKITQRNQKLNESKQISCFQQIAVKNYQFISQKPPVPTVIDQNVSSFVRTVHETSVDDQLKTKRTFKTANDESQELSKNYENIPASTVSADQRGEKLKDVIQLNQSQRSQSSKPFGRLQSDTNNKTQMDVASQNELKSWKVNNKFSGCISFDQDLNADGSKNARMLQSSIALAKQSNVHPLHQTSINSKQLVMVTDDQLKGDSNQFNERLPSTHSPPIKQSSNNLDGIPSQPLISLSPAKTAAENDQLDQGRSKTPQEIYYHITQRQNQNGNQQVVSESSKHRPFRKNQIVNPNPFSNQYTSKIVSLQSNKQGPLNSNDLYSIRSFTENNHNFESSNQIQDNQLMWVSSENDIDNTNQNIQSEKALISDPFDHNQAYQETQNKIAMENKRIIEQNQQISPGVSVSMQQLLGLSSASNIGEKISSGNISKMTFNQNKPNQISHQISKMRTQNLNLQNSADIRENLCKSQQLNRIVKEHRVKEQDLGLMHLKKIQIHERKLDCLTHFKSQRNSDQQVLNRAQQAYLGVSANNTSKSLKVVSVHSVSPRIHLQNHFVRKSRNNQFKLDEYPTKLDAINFSSQQSLHKEYLRQGQPKYILDRLKQSGAYGNAIVLVQDGVDREEALRR